MTARQLYSACVALWRIPTYMLLLLYVGAGTLFGLIHSGSGTATVSSRFIISMLLFMVCVGLWYMNGTAINDYADYEIDLINLKNDKSRPLITHALTKKHMAIIALVSAVSALLVAASLNTSIFILVTILVFLNWAYSMPPFSISKRGAAAPLLLPLGYVTLPILGGMMLSTSHVSAAPLFIAALYMIFMSRILLKDYRDVVGDAKHGKRTALLRYGSKAICRASAICASAGYVLLFVSLRQHLFTALVPLLFLAGLGYSALAALAKEKTWPHQRPFITSYGRIQTGVLLILILSLIFWLSPISSRNQFTAFLSACILIILSVREVMVQQAPKRKS